jgi:superfamily II DNA or RNA helicase
MVTLYENATHVIVTGKPKELDVLVDDFKFRPEGHYYALSYQRFKVSEGKEGWDGYIYPLFRINSTSAKALRGRKEDIIRAAELEGFKVDLSHLLPYPFADLEIDDVRPDLIAGDHVLDMNQRQCILDWLQAGIGFNKVTVGGGKTATFAGAAALIKEKHPEARFLYITPSERLVRQVTREMKKYLPHFDVGQCGGGHHDFEAKDMVVCTVAMLNTHYNGLKIDEWFDSFMGILYDEVHHAGSKTSKKILLTIPAYFRLGASDTAKENDPTRYNEVRGLFGPMLNEVHAAPLIEKGRLARPHIYVVDVPGWLGRFRDIPYRPEPKSKAFILLESEWVEAEYAGPVYELDDEGKPKMKSIKTAEKDAEDNWIYEEQPITIPGRHRLLVGGEEVEIESRWCLLNRMYDRAIIQFKSRNAMISEWVKYFNRKGWPTVVVATRTTHVYILENLLKQAVGEEKVRVLIGEDSPTERDAAFAWFKETPGSVLVTPLVKEGVSINEIRAMVVADHVADHEVARQIIGRAMRPKKGDDNRAHVVWFWDKQHPVLRRGCAQIFNQLERVEGFQFYHPCQGPETVFPDDFRSSSHERRIHAPPV